MNMIHWITMTGMDKDLWLGDRVLQNHSACIAY